jgi:hypothetical protein
VPLIAGDDKAAFGVNFEVLNPEATAYPHEVCASPSTLTTAKTFDGLDYVQDANVVTLYSGVECGFLDFAEHAEKAITKMERGVSHALETYLRSDVFLTGTAFTPTFSSLIGVFVEAEWEAAQVYQAELLVHLSPVSASFLNDARVVAVDGEGVLRTLLGSRVVVGTGYTSNAAPIGGAASVAGSEWAFFTGAMDIRRGEMGVHEAFAAEVNKHQALAECVYSIAIDGPILGVSLTLEA